MLRSGIRLSPSDIRYASLGGEYNITATYGRNITVACNNITLTRSAYHFQFDMAFVSTNAVLVKKRRRTFGAHKSKAPSERELPTKSGEGERVTIKLVQIQSCAGSFRHASRATFLPEEGYVSTRQYGKGVRTKSLVLLFVFRQVKPALWKAPFRRSFLFGPM